MQLCILISFYAQAQAFHAKRGLRSKQRLRINLKLQAVPRGIWCKLENIKPA